MIEIIMLLTLFMVLALLKTATEMILINAWCSLKPKNSSALFFVLSIISIPLIFTIILNNHWASHLTITGPYALTSHKLLLDLFAGFNNALIGSIAMCLYSRNLTTVLKSAVVFFITGFFLLMICQALLPF